MMKTMRSQHEPKVFSDGSPDRELRLLSEVQHNSQLTQRDLSQRVGIALGLTNVLVRNLSAKGYVRVTQAGWKRWLYALTPAGFSRKIQLTVAYLHRTLDHYKKARQTLLEELKPFALNEESRVAIYGTGEFAELVYLGLKDIGIEEIVIFSSGLNQREKFLGMPVQELATLRPEEYDRVVIALLPSSAEDWDQLQRQGVTQEKLVRFFEGNHAPEEM